MTSTFSGEEREVEREADAFEIVLADGRKMGMKVRRWEEGKIILGRRMMVQSSLLRVTPSEPGYSVTLTRLSL